MEKPLKMEKKYTREQYRKDKKKLIGVGFLILAFFLVLLTLWHRDRFADRQIYREQKAIEREEGVIPDMTIPAFDFGEIMEKAGIGELLKTLEKEVPTEKYSFQNFTISLPTTIEEFPEKQKFENNIKQFLGQNVSVKFFAQNNIDKNLIKKQLLEQFMKQGQQEQLFELDVDMTGMLPPFSLFTIIELQEINNLIDFKALLESIEKKDSGNFEIAEIKIIKETENEIQLKTTFLVTIGMQEQPKKRFYSYKKLRIINDNAYLFAFLDLAEIDEESQKELDKILESVIIK